MNKLSPDFELDRYGMHVRLALETDAEFIHELRTAPKIAPYMHIDGSSVSQQREWLQQYKVREGKGEEYYFVFEIHGEPIGVLRLCHFDGTHYHCSSWAFKDNLPSHFGIAGALVAREIAYEMLDMEQEENWRDGIVATNRNVIAFMKLLGWKQTNERYEGETKFITGVMTKEDFYKNKKKIMRFFPKEYQQ